VMSRKMNALFRGRIKEFMSVNRSNVISNRARKTLMIPEVGGLHHRYERSAA